MPTALWTLIALHLRGRMRRMVQGVRTPRGVFFVLLGCFMLVAWLGPMIWRATHTPRGNPDVIRTVAPFAILAFCVMNLFGSLGEKAITFTAAEVDFLFPGPFTRRSLLAYKVLRTMLGGLFTTVVFSIMLLRHSNSWFACFIGIWLTIQFIQLFAMSITLVGQTIGERAYSGARRAILLAAVILLAIAAAPVLWNHMNDRPIALMRQVHQTLAGQVLLAPFSVFARVITAPGASLELLMWATIALAIDLAMFGIVFGLDANYLETAAVVSQRRYERLQRVRRGGVAAMTKSNTATWGIPPFPWLGGIGPIAWRQVTTAVRNVRALFTVGIILAVVVVAFGAQIRNSNASESAIGNMLGLFAWLNVVFISMLKFDFRDEIDRMDVLRSLPIRPVALAAAELVTPVAILTAIWALLLIAMAIAMPAGRPLLAWGAAFAVPFNLLLAGVENFLFLLFPVRTVGLVAGDMQLFGRQMVLFLCKFILLVIALAIAAAVGLVGYIAGRASWTGFGIAAWVGLVAVSLSLIPLIARAYVRFDPSVDTPT